MKVITLVGVRKSGKTTTVTGLIREMKKRGYRVGTVKSVFCPEFSMDTKDSNTWKHREAGADLVMTAYDVAAASMVLLKNNDKILPLKSSQKIALTFSGN